MNHYMVMSIISPFISAVLAATLTYRFSIKTKRFDILYANKIPAFKEILNRLTEFKIFCDGRVAYYQGNEYSPYFEEKPGALSHRSNLTTSFDLNSVFISENSKKKMSELLGKISILCSAEAAVIAGEEDIDIEDLYKDLSVQTKGCISTLYSELDIEN